VNATKFTAVAIAALIVISSVTMCEVMIQEIPENEVVPSIVDQSFRSRPFEVGSVLSQAGLWVYFDSSAQGTPAEAHVTVSDTSGITIVADFHGFWRSIRNISGILYDDLEMPGASSINEHGKPMLPCLFEYVQIPYDVDVSIEVLASSSANTSGYSIRPAPAPDISVGVSQTPSNLSSTTPPTFLDPVYSNNKYFPGNTTKTEGESNSTSMIMRGHRLLGLSFYPVQFNPVTRNLTVYSQFVVKVKYSFPAQIEPIAEHLRSEPFERILNTTVLNCYSSVFRYAIGVGLVTWPILIHPFFEGAEYLIITTQDFKSQADRLAEWKMRKGLLSKVSIVPTNSRESVKNLLEFVYYHWNPVPTYVLLLGDVEYIPANYDVDHLAKFNGVQIHENTYDEYGNIASDLGYFNIEGNGYFPEMIYSRISVDTEMQAEIIVNKTLQYENFPIIDPLFYKSFLSAGYFEDQVRPYGVEDELIQCIYNLERIRHYLNDTLGYNAHINYSLAGAAYDETEPEYYRGVPLEALEFQEPILGSYLVSESLPDDFVWLWGYDHPDKYPIPERWNITLNFNEGRFLVLYFGHGDSKNMIYPVDVNDDSAVNRNDRGLVEGWQHPSFNTSHFSDLINENRTPLVVSVSCTTGWFDGETDENYMDLVSPSTIGRPNPFLDYENECFAENITRLDGSGAIAVIASSRAAYAEISGYLMDGIIQSFWPGFLHSMNQPIYEMGGALLYSKLYAVKKYTSNDNLNRRRTTFEAYHLFGDPETQLWTDVPSPLTVEYPDQIGIGTQEFVVTVTNNIVPVPYAKVCLQKGSDIYQVGYTDPQGQVIFNVHPSFPGMMNLTVTKHNWIPHIGELEVVCSGATLTLTPEEGPVGASVRFSVHGFYDTEDVEIYYESQYVVTLSAGASRSESAPSDIIGYVNIIAKGYDSNLVAIAVYRCYPSNPRSDPYIFSQWDESTWEIAGLSGDDIGWYNPDIAVYSETTYPIIPASVSPTTTYAVWVKVHNQGDTAAIDTTVTLRYAEIGGGASWPVAGVDIIETISVGYWEYARILWTPPKDGKFCLKAEIHNANDMNLDNNVGVLAVDVVEYSSPGYTDFWVGNPTDTDHYVFIHVRQQGNYSDVWNAMILDYSSQVINSTQNETVSLQIDPGPNPGENEWRLFVADIYVEWQLVGGISFNVSKAQPPPPDSLIGLITLAILGGIGALVVLVAFWKRKK
jgi:hypothetical protein